MITEGQQLACEQLKKIESVNNLAFEILEIENDIQENGFLKVCISIYCNEFKTIEGGLPLRAREKLKIYIPKDFPFTVPSVYSFHNRFDGFPHVQWKNSLCIYQAKEIEWNPSDGMYGFIKRIEDWFRMGALNQLDQTGEPLHPPVAYSYGNEVENIVIEKNTPIIKNISFIGFAEIEQINISTYKVVNWEDNIYNRTTDNNIVSLAILLNERMPFEFPNKLSDLFDELKKREITLADIILKLIEIIKINKSDKPVFFILGSPMRGIAGSDDLKQHLTAWKLPVLMKDIIELIPNLFDDNTVLKEIGEKSFNLLLDYIKSQRVYWCNIFENREEIVIRRDHVSNAKEYKGKSISIWGCGALGANIAIFLARLGVKELFLYDNGIVKPGILVRQPYKEIDIGEQKVIALKKRIKEINSNIVVNDNHKNIKTLLLEGKEFENGKDLIIDCTASNQLHLAFENTKLNFNVPIISMIVNERSENACMICLGKKFSGGLYDLYRKAKLETCNLSELSKFNKTFFDNENSRKIFQPIPGCSEPTFEGSVIDAVELSSSMLDLGVNIFKLDENKSSTLFLEKHRINNTSFNRELIFEKDFICRDSVLGYEIRISPKAWKNIKMGVNKNDREYNRNTETGGLLFGYRNDLLKVIWIDEILNSPKDSFKSESNFICGIDGVKDYNEYIKRKYKNNIYFLGNWHTHPNSEPVPSKTDFEAIKNIFKMNDYNREKTLLMILTPNVSEYKIGCYLYEKEHFLIDKKKEIEIIKNDKQKSIGLALSGGGSRAIAFHLGCMRALNDMGILDKINVISSVSGGSVISAMYAYSDKNFKEFEKDVENLLKKGLVKSIIFNFLTSKDILEELLFFLIKNPCYFICKLFGKKINFRRKNNRTSSFIRALDKLLFKGLKINSKRKNDVNIIINSTEMTTGTAFRIGSKESGCWRFGRIKNNDISLAEAVAYSAAYPVLLPSVDEEYDFENKDKTSKKRVLISDGGIYENLGISCFDPDKNPNYSYNCYKVDYIISCNAGYGMFDESFFPINFIERMTRTVEAIMRKNQDEGMNNLHSYKESGKVKGFILSYLGQDDSKLPMKINDLISRNEVNYPTDFNPMKEKDIIKLSKRGEQLTKNLIDYYYPEL